MKNTIWINNNWYDLQKSVAKLQENLPLWERDIFSFLVEWFTEGDFIYVQTSGSTGTPKTIKKEKSTLRNSALMTGDFFSFKENQIALLCLPVKYIAGKMMLVRAIEWGLKLDSIEPKIKLNIPSKNYHFSAMTPQQVSASINTVSNISNLIIGGAPISIPLEKQLLDLPINCYATYGMTETVSHIALRKITENNNHYQVLSGIEINIDSRTCLTINAPKLSVSIIKTNDIVTLNSANSFTWLGRFDNVINSGGVKISPEIIENKISKLIPNHFFITGIPDDKWGESVVLIIEGNPIDSKKLQKSIDAVLNKVETPKSIHFLPTFIRTENGKLNRKKTLNSFITNHS